MRTHFIAKLAAVLTACGLASAAYAGSAEKEIRAYKKLNVTFTHNAERCGFESKAAFERHLKNRLAKVGMKQNDSSIVIVTLEVGGIPFGALETQCAVDANLNFVTLLRAEDIVTQNPAVRKALDRLQAFPISLYEVGAFAVDTTLMVVYDNRNITMAEKKVFEIVNNLVKRFDTDRKKK